MAKWVTFYYSMGQGISHYQEHKNREEAEKHYLATYKNYFAMNTLNKKKFKLPYVYGFPHRKFVGMTKYKFDKYYK